MSDEIGTYSFLPWFRQGIANNISDADMDPGVRLRSSVPVELTLTGKGVDGPDINESIPKTVALYGPGDIIGIDQKAIIKNEPLNWITNFEANYLPYIDFYDEDFPWRYTPAAPNHALRRLRPWITLAVLKEDEFSDGKNIKDKPLPYIDVEDFATVLPPADQLWAWAHVHIDRDVVERDDNVINANKNDIIPRIQSLLDSNPDLAHARLLCPRRLEANTAYHAFLMPTFESGRLAGLGLDPATEPTEVHATFSAWGEYSDRSLNEPQSFPYYHRWYFRTGNVGDFEYLVRLLKPQPMDSRVGRRPMDVQKPAVNIDGITDEDLGGILKLGGALRIPFDTLGEEDKADVLKYDNWADPYPHPFQEDLSKFINLADDYNAQSAIDANRDAGFGKTPDSDPETDPDPDPLITSPLYARWHAIVQRLLTNRDGSPASNSQNWVHELNLDPRWRVTAGFGTGVIQKKQEEYMDAAWSQVGEVLEANRKIRYAQLAKEVSWIWYDKHITPLQQANPEKALLVTTPVQKRIIVQEATVYHQINTSVITRATTSTPMRAMTRSKSRMMKALPFSPEISATNLLERINTRQVDVAPPKTVPETTPTLDDVSDDVKPSVPGPLARLLLAHPWLVYLPLVLALLLFLIFFGVSLACSSSSLAGTFSAITRGIVGIIIAGLLYLFFFIRRVLRQLRDADSIPEEKQTPASVEDLPKSPDFRIVPISSGFTPRQGGEDSPEAVRFKSALRDAYGFVQLSGKAGPIPELHPVDLNLMVNGTIAGINPEVTLPRLVLNQIQIPGRIVDLIGEKFKEAMAYPEIDIPMYKPLVDISSDLFLPNINFVPQNSISLLETNQKFIESYMVGLNHEFARELLWREYPTDQRGSYFRQFWDVSSYLNKKGLSEEELKEKLRDIPPLHRWSRSSELGEHDNRETQGENEEELVLVIRGELLKKYPNAVIYAHRAKWQLQDGQIDNTQERLLDESEPIEDNVKTPLYEAKVDPDISFFGFDLTATEAQGGTGENPDDDPGWFFVIKERPGEPRFGLDIDREGDINLWNDLAWEDAMPGIAGGDFLQLNEDTPAIALQDPTGDPQLQEKVEQYQEDRHITWNKDINSAELAYILYQVPVLVAVHASEMLPKD